jgi:xanthine dehydrogenase accessory factor
MQDIIEEFQAWLHEGKQVALATVIKTWGSAPRPVSSKMAVSEKAEMVGSVSGGCVESAVIEEALDVLKTGRPRLLNYAVQDEQAWDVGLACGGQMQVYVEAVPIGSGQAGASPSLLEAIREQLRQGRPVVRAVVIRGPDEVLGQGAVFAQEGKLAGSGISVEAGKLSAEVEAAFVSGSSRSQIYPLPDGELEIFFDFLRPAPTLVIVGGVHIAMLLTRLAKILGFRVIIVDPRRQFASPERFPQADNLVLLWPDEGLRSVGLTQATAVAVLSHDPKLDDPALLVALRSEAAYIGALGSGQSAASRRRRLLAAGVQEEELARLHTPIGIDGLADTPEEIALGILAQIAATPGL